MKTESEHTEAESPKPRSAAETGTEPRHDELDPDCPIEVTGGPSDGSGDPHTGPIKPPKA